MYMVGTPAKTVTFRSIIRSSAAAPSKRGISSTEAPARNAAFMTTV